MQCIVDNEKYAAMYICTVQMYRSRSTLRVSSQDKAKHISSSYKVVRSGKVSPSALHALRHQTCKQSHTSSQLTSYKTKASYFAKCVLRQDSVRINWQSFCQVKGVLLLDVESLSH